MCLNPATFIKNLEILRTKSRISYLKESIGMIIGFYNNKNGLFF